MSDISPAAEAAREAHRNEGGQFGHQGRTAPGDLRSGDHSAPAGRSPARRRAQRLAGQFRRQTEAFEDLALRHELADIAYETPSGVRYVQLMRWDEEVNDDGGYDIALDETFDNDGNCTGTLSGYGSWSSKFGSGNIWSSSWVDEDDRLDLDKVRAWARTAESHGAEADAMMFDSFLAADDAPRPAGTISRLADHAGVGVFTLERSNFDEGRDLSDDQWDKIRADLPRFSDFINNSGASDSIDHYIGERLEAAGVYDNEEDRW